MATPAAAWSPVRNGGLGHDNISGHGGPDHISGREGPDTLYGRGGGDLLSGDNGPDILYGGAGRDTLIGGAGRDRLYGASGDDIASGGFGADYLTGGAGDDELEGGQDDDTIIGGAGDDVLVGGSGGDVLDGGDGNDRIFADTGADLINAGAGDDVIIVDGSAATRVTCGPGNDTVYVTMPANELGDYGTKGTEGRRSPDCEHVFSTDAVVDPNQGIRYLAPDTGGRKLGTSRDDVLLGGLGKDVLSGGGGNDVLWGLRQAGLTSAKPDVLDGGSGDDTIYGGPSFQTIRGGSGQDRIQAGVGSGRISGGPGADSIRMRADGHGTYKIDAGSGNDTIYARGGASHARITCGPGHDVVHVDAHDRVSRDCEKVIGTPAGRRAATASLRADTAGLYASMILATPGLKHYFRLDAPPTEYDINGVPNYWPSTTIHDTVSGIDGTSGARQTADGVTDDGDKAWDSSGSAEGEGMTIYTWSSVLQDDFTFEAWIRGVDSGVARALLTAAPQSSAGDRTTLVREADGSLHGQITSSSETAKVDIRTAPLDLAPGVWHHIAWTRSSTATALYVDGEQVSSAPAVPVHQAISVNWLIGQAFDSVQSWRGGFDEIALYDRSLDAGTLRSHARFGSDGVAPVTTMTPAIPALVGTVTTHLATAKGGSSFRCSLDQSAYFACPADLLLKGLKDGGHELRVLATDRFGVVEQTPQIAHFTVDAVPPRTLGAVLVGLGDNPTAIATFGSDSAAHFECQVTSPYYQAPYPCTSSVQVTRGVSFTVAAIDDAGNRDPSPVSLTVPRLGTGNDARSGYYFGGVMQTFAGVRHEVFIGGEDEVDYRTPFQCRTDDSEWFACSRGYYLPIMHAGHHLFQVRQATRGGTAVIYTAPLSWDVAGPGGFASIVGLQFPAVVEGGARLKRRVPRVRLALGTAARITVDVIGHSGAKLAHVEVAGTSGPNTVKISANVLGRLKPDRYGIIVTATAPRGPPAVQRVSFAIVPPAR